jgi:hypothetical protein
MELTRAAGTAGFLFIGIVISVTILLGAAGQPAFDASPEEVARVYGEHNDAVGIASGIAPLAWLALIVFGAGAFNAVRGDAWSVVGIAGIVMQNAIFAGVVGTQVALWSGEAGAEVTGMLWDLHNALFALNTLSLATALLGFSLGGLRTGVLRRWHASLGLGAASIFVVAGALTPLRIEGPPALEAFALLGFLGWLVWVTVFAATLRGRSRDEARGSVPVVAGAGA